MAQKQIIIIKGQEFKIKETGITENDFFYNVYKQASDRLNEIVNSSPKKLEDNEFNSCEFNNNIIAFCGERGQGKSSAMLTFSKALEKYTESKNSCDNAIRKLFSYNGETLDKLFYILDPIDPTQLEKKDDILKIVVSRIFAEFKKYWRDGQRSKNNIELKNEMLGLFQKCYKHIITIKNSSEPKYEDISFEDSLEELARLGDSSNLKMDLYALIYYFFKIRFNEKEYNKYMLVVQIDDTDLNVKKAYEIIEDIRKYLMIPNVVILMATKIEQLTKAVEQQYRLDFKTLINNGRISQCELQQMASKYIDKLIPDGRKIYLPVISTIADSSEEQVIIQYYNNNNETILDNADCNNLQDQLFKYIYIKTGLIFVKPDTGMHCFIPKTMRELVNLLAILSKMNDIGDIKKNYEINSTDKIDSVLNSIEIDHDTRKNNIGVFEDYFLNTWIRNNIDDAYISYLSNMVYTPNDLKHRRIITDMFDVIEKSEIYSLKKPSKENNQGRLDFLNDVYKDKKNYIKPDILQYSFGDVMDVIEKVEDIYQNESVFLFTFAIKMIYTITLNKVFLNSCVKENDEPLKEFIGIDIFRKNIYSGYIDPFDVPISSDMENKISNFVFKGYTNPDFDYMAYKEEKSKNNASFSLLKFNISIPILKFIYKSVIERNNTFVFFFLNAEVITALQNHLIKYNELKNDQSKFTSLRLFYENIQRFIKGTRRKGVVVQEYKPKFLPYDFKKIDIQIEYIMKEINDNRDYFNKLFDFAPTKNIAENINVIIGSFKRIRTSLDKESNLDSAIKRINSFINKANNLDKAMFTYEYDYLKSIKMLKDELDTSTSLNEGDNRDNKRYTLDLMDKFIESINKPLGGEA